jgi:EAL domain-containing protein (putative c-di-GMP-specific phosphodiesterase class I)
MFGPSQESVEELMKRADMAMYQAKAAGRNTFRFFEPEMQAVIAARIELENELRIALQHDQFVLHYQPQFNAEGELMGAEAFVRWLHPKRGVVSPATFIPLAEETGLIVRLGHFVLTAACEQLHRWSLSPATSGLTMEVKVSGQELRQGDYVHLVLRTIKDAGAKAQLLKLELNESLLTVDVEDIIEKTRQLSRHGVVFSLADLGTGYSSLSHLRRLALDQLRIDQSFVRGLLTNSNDAAVTRSIFALADSLKLKVGAEGVETQEQRDVLAAHGCIEFQGYLFSQPLKVDDFERLLVGNLRREKVFD